MSSSRAQDNICEALTDKKLLLSEDLEYRCGALADNTIWDNSLVIKNVIETG